MRLKVISPCSACKVTSPWCLTLNISALQEAATGKSFLRILIRARNANRLNQQGCPNLPTKRFLNILFFKRERAEYILRLKPQTCIHVLNKNWVTCMRAIF